MSNDIVQRLRDYGVAAHDGPPLYPAICKEAANEIERLRAALQDVKVLVVGDRAPNWVEDGWRVTMTRGKIADLCDIALGAVGDRPDDATDAPLS